MLLGRRVSSHTASDPGCFTRREHYYPSTLMATLLDANPNLPCKPTAAPPPQGCAVSTDGTLTASQNPNNTNCVLPCEPRSAPSPQGTKGSKPCNGTSSRGPERTGEGPSLLSARLGHERQTAVHVQGRGPGVGPRDDRGEAGKEGKRYLGDDVAPQPRSVLPAACKRLTTLT
jgi:hypothetical protein